MADYNISQHFKRSEFEKSVTAKAYGINNQIPDKYMKNLQVLVKDVLEPIRQEWNAPIVVSSGYRCETLNKRIGGASNSQHCTASAADIHTKEDTKQANKKLFDLICKMAYEGKISTRQIIDEYDYNWVHVSINDKSHGYKDNQILHLK